MKELVTTYIILNIKRIIINTMKQNIKNRRNKEAEELKYMKQ